MSLQQVTFAIANQRGVVPRQVAHQGDIRMAVRPGPAQDDPVVQTDEITADGVDPEQEPALGAGQRRPEPAGEAARACEGSRATGERSLRPRVACPRGEARGGGEPPPRFSPVFSQTMPWFSRSAGSWSGPGATGVAA